MGSRQPITYLGFLAAGTAKTATQEITKFIHSPKVPLTRLTLTKGRISLFSPSLQQKNETLNQYILCVLPIEVHILMGREQDARCLAVGCQAALHTARSC